MDLKCGRKVCKDVLEEALKCADGVHNTIEKQEMPKGKNEKDDTVIRERWTNLNKAFKENLQKICLPKPKKMDN
jgi:DNA-binding IscR family transcriptional regulator